MADIRFTLLPDDLPTDKIIGIPDAEYLANFALGNIGIADNIRKNNTLKTLSTQVSSEQEATQFLELSNIEIKKDISAYRRNNVYDIPSSDITVKPVEGGINGLEKTILQTVFDTQAPLVDISLVLINFLATLEDSAAIFLAGSNDRSLKPQFNENSLYSKFIGANGDIQKVQQVIKKNNINTTKIDYSKNNIEEQYNSNNIINKKNNQTIVSYSNNRKIDSPHFSVISEIYSTGRFIKNIPYKYTYIDKPLIDNNPSTEISTITEISSDESPQTVIFGIFADIFNDGKTIIEISPEQLPSGWNIINKPYFRYDSYNSESESIFEVQLKTDILNVINTKLDEQNITDIDERNEVIDTVLNSIPFSDTKSSEDEDVNLFDEYKKSSLQTALSDANSDISKILTGTGFRTKRTTFNGKPTFIDSNNYVLQTIKVVPSSTYTNNNHLNTSNPFVGNYDNQTVTDIIELDTNQPTQFIRQTNSNNIIHTIFRKSNSGKTKDVNPNDLIYGRTKKKNFIDTAAIYIIEGVYTETPSTTETTLPDKQWYKINRPGKFIKALLKALSKFIKYTIIFLPLLFRKARTLVKTFKEPHSLISDSLLNRVKDNFDSLSPDMVSDLIQLEKQKNIDRKLALLEQKPLLKKYVSYDQEKGTFTYLLNQETQIKFFNKVVKMGITDAKPYFNISKDKDGEVNVNEIPEDNSDTLDSLPLLKFITNIVLFPIKIVIGLVQYIIDFFKNIKLRKLSTQLKDFISFKWILDFFKPSNLLKLLGIKIDTVKLKEDAKSNKSDEIDTNKNIKIPFISKMPKYSKEQITNLLETGSLIIGAASLIDVLKDFLDNILCFVFNIFNIDVLFPCPSVRIELLLENIDETDLNKLINQADLDFINNIPQVNNKLSYIYTIQLSDGRVVRGINYYELQRFLSQNNNIKYKFDYND